MTGIWLVFKKEMLELSKDRKTLFFTFAMPFLIYPRLFGMMSKMGKTDEARRDRETVQALKTAGADPP